MTEAVELVLSEAARKALDILGQQVGAALPFTAFDAIGDERTVLAALDELIDAGLIYQVHPSLAGEGSLRHEQNPF